jgi:acyl dehydratase
MPIDPVKALGTPFEETRSSWGQDDIILYHLGVGAGWQATDPKELEYTYEGHLKVLPSFAVIPAQSCMPLTVPGLEFDPALMLHGEQELIIHSPVPTAADVIHSGRVAELWDKGKAAVAVFEMSTRDASSGDLICVNRFSTFLRGEGGFGGESGPKPGNEPPERAPDIVVESPTLPQQALLYRLNGDKNPLHADPEFAKLGGFDRPILHGLCSYGIVCKAVVDHALDGDTAAVARYQVRFAGVVFPGETIVTSMWHENDQVLVQAHVKERNTPVITNAVVARSH